jgi:hypothetical protein
VLNEALIIYAKVFLGGTPLQFFIFGAFSFYLMATELARDMIEARVMA